MHDEPEEPASRITTREDMATFLDAVSEDAVQRGSQWDLRHAALTFNDIVIVRDTPATRRDAVAGLRGTVAGISQSDETGEVVAYAIWLPACEEVWMFDISQLDPTGENDPNGNPMSGESIRVSQRGELIDGPFPTDG